MLIVKLLIECLWRLGCPARALYPSPRPDCPAPAAGSCRGRASAASAASAAAVHAPTPARRCTYACARGAASGGRHSPLCRMVAAWCRTQRRTRSTAAPPAATTRARARPAKRQLGRSCAWRMPQVTPLKEGPRASDAQGASRMPRRTGAVHRGTPPKNHRRARPAAAPTFRRRARRRGVQTGAGARRRRGARQCSRRLSTASARSGSSTRTPTERSTSPALGARVSGDTACARGAAGGWVQGAGQTKAGPYTLRATPRRACTHQGITPHLLDHLRLALVVNIQQLQPRHPLIISQPKRT